MSKKHFEWAARELAAARLAGTFDTRETHAIKTFCATMFQHFNPRFDWARFESRVDGLIADAADSQPGRIVRRSGRVA